MILCSNPGLQYEAHKTEIDAAIRRVLDSGWYVLGKEVKGFEGEFAEFIGVDYAVGVGSGTEAIHLALAACGVVPGDEVITVSHTAVATVAAIEMAGATPVLVDIDPVHFTMDPTRLESAVTARTKAIIPVHIYGQPADLSAIMDIAGRRGIRVIEDCCQAHGATYHGRRVGAWGDVACFSFYPTKNLGALGDGGMVVTQSPELGNQARRLREYGWNDRRASEVPGWNSRLDELQAAVLRVKLRHLDRDNGARVEIADRYDRELEETELILPARRTDAQHVFHLYVIRSSCRDALLKHMHAHQVRAAIHYPVPVHLQPAYRGRLPGSADLPETERAFREILSLPIYPELGREEQSVVIEAIKQICVEESAV